MNKISHFTAEYPLGSKKLLIEAFMDQMKPVLLEKTTLKVKKYHYETHFQNY